MVTSLTSAISFDSLVGLHINTSCLNHCKLTVFISNKPDFPSAKKLMGQAVLFVETVAGEERLLYYSLLNKATDIATSYYQWKVIFEPSTSTSILNINVVMSKEKICTEICFVVLIKCHIESIVNMEYSLQHSRRDFGSTHLTCMTFVCMWQRVFIR